MTDKAQTSAGAEGDSRVVQMGEGAVIDDGVVLGYPASRGENHVLAIGPEAHIRSRTIAPNSSGT